MRNLYNIIKAEYMPDPLNDESPLKRVVYHSLNEIEIKIIYLYAELGSVKKTAKHFNVSEYYLRKQIKKIQAKLKETLQRYGY